MLLRSAKGNWKWAYIWGTIVYACHQDIGGKVVTSQDAKPLERLSNLHLNFFQSQNFTSAMKVRSITTVLNTVHRMRTRNCLI